ncbi:ring-opening amidohydrolase [Microbacterium sp. ASV49]|uniref:Ring-opening amidohydrolase n=1 Tax=Microbacterium candidum TaxID=3041922 RepID=A0ABT7MVE9_9MICO|nr:ring-opening amidohydrolase [Microbacterium sp. ASV49]MDL9978388.1 ring-opening amidohydrolase [Microbacterium sp. ASV49]
MTPTTAIDAHRVATGDPADVSGLAALIDDGLLRPDDVVAVTGKIEGWEPGDTGRVDAHNAVRRLLLDRGTRSADRIEQIPMAFSAGVGTILTPHLVVYTRIPSEPAADGAPRLALGTSRSEVIRPEWVGTARAVQVNADAVRAGAADAGIRPEEVEFVVGKSYYPTPAEMDAARAVDPLVLDADDETMFRIGSGSAALGVGVATEGLAMPSDDQIGSDLDVWSGRLSVSCNPWEGTGGPGPQSQLMVFGNRPGAGGRLRVGHAAFADVLDVGAVPRALRRAGVEVGDGPLTAEQSARIVGVYIKFENPVGGELRGRRQVTQDPSYSRTMRSVIAGAFASMLQDTMIWASAGAVQQGPAGGGTLAIVTDVG